MRNLRCSVRTVVGAVVFAVCLGAAPGWAEFGESFFVSPVGLGAKQPRAAMDRAGRTLIVWRKREGDSAWIEARLRNASGKFRHIEIVSEKSQIGTFEEALIPRLAMNADGRALVVWQSANRGVQVRARSAAGLWGPVETVAKPDNNGSDAGNSLDAHVVIDPDGNALVVWRHWPSSSSRSRTVSIQARARSAAGNWGPIEYVWGPDNADFPPL